MKKGTSNALFVVAIFGLIIWNIFDKEKEPVSSKNHTKTSTEERSKPKVNPWPFVDSSNDAAEVVDNLLATNIYVVFDGSGSMEGSACSGGEHKIIAAKKALWEFVKSIPASANVGMLVFDISGTKERVPLKIVNYDQLEQTINDVHSGGGTPLSTAIDHAYKALTKQARMQLGYGEYHLLVVTDGRANDGFDPTNNLNRILSESPVIVHTIGFCIGKNHSLNQPGRTFYSTAQDYDSLRKGLQGVLAEAPEFTVSDFN